MNKSNPTVALLRIRQSLFDNADYLILIASAIFYIVLMFHLSYLKYYTFQDTFYDLGLNNEIMWLLSHGFISNYIHSQFSQIYPFQYEKPIVFLVLPFYSLYPHISTLLFIQTLFLGLTVFPIYFSSRIIVRSRAISLIVALSSSNVSSNNSQAVILEVSSGNMIFDSKVIYRNDFQENNSIKGFTLTVTFSTVTQYVEFRGLMK